MKKLYTLIIGGLIGVLGASAQSLNVNIGGITYNFPADDNVIPFASGKTVTIQGHTFNLADISSMTVGNAIVTSNYVNVEYSDAGAKVSIAGNIADYIDVAIDGGYVTITQSDAVDDTVGEISYKLSGESADGSFTLYGSYKSSIELAGVSLTSNKGAAIDIQNGKRIAIRLAEGTVNTLVDAANGEQKGCISCKGHLEFKQKGTLNVTGNTGHGIFSKEYIETKNATLNVLGAVKDGINCNQYMLVESGNISVKNVQDDGIQVSFKDDVDRETEDTGTITIKGGTFDIEVTAKAAKAIKADGDIVVSAGNIKALTSGHGLWDATNSKTKASSCFGADGAITISGGTFDFTSTGGGGKGISCDGVLNISGGDFTITTTGGMYAYVNNKEYTSYTGNADNVNSKYKSSPKGIKGDSEIVIDGGTFNISTKGNGGEGIESKKTLTINDGTFKIRAYDDGTNSATTTTIAGGDLEVMSTVGDGIDANGDIYIKGGFLRIFGAASPEQGFDAGDGCTIYFTGGTFLATAGANSVPSKATSTQAYVSLSSTVTAGTTVTIGTTTETLASFEIPSDYNPNSRAGNRPGGGGGMGNGGKLVISTPQLVSGTSYTVKLGSTSSTATAKLTN